MTDNTSTVDPEMAIREARAKKFNTPVVLTDSEKKAQRANRFENKDELKQVLMILDVTNTD
jgi:hypothetical protein